ncbi:Nonsense-mediated mRNA decay protein 5 [Dimargaris cristalligena]|nr:Nonsense-mediated mRNA decay protein 5 [Dimargaris cristalligena]
MSGSNAALPPWVALCARSPSSLQMMPPRVLRRICHYLGNDPVDLLHLAQTCRDLKAYSLEYLWRRPRFRSPEAFSSFLAAVTKQRYYAARIRSLCLTIAPDQALPIPVYAAPLDEPDSDPSARPADALASPSTTSASSASARILTTLDPGHLLAPVAASQRSAHLKLRSSILADPQIIISLVRVCDQLRDLTIYGWQLRDTDLLTISSLTPCLRQWAIIGGCQYSASTLVQVVHQLPHLVSFALDTELTLTSAFDRLASPPGRSFRRLHITGDGIPAQSLTPILARQSALQSLTVAPLLNYSDTLLHSWLGHMCRLQSVTLADSAVTMETVRIMTENCNQLQYLDVRRADKFGPDPTTVEWMMPVCMSLQALVVANLALTDDIMLMMSNSCRQIQAIGCQECPLFTDEGLNHLVENLYALRAVTCVGCPQITESALILLKQHQRAHLRYLVLEQCRITSATAVEQFVRECPQLELILIKGVETIQQAFSYHLQRSDPCPAKASSSVPLDRVFAPLYSPSHPLFSMAAKQITDQIMTLATASVKEKALPGIGSLDPLATEWLRHFAQFRSVKPEPARPTPKVVFAAAPSQPVVTRVDRSTSSSEKRPRPSSTVYPRETTHGVRSGTVSYARGSDSPGPSNSVPHHVEPDEGLPVRKHRKSMNERVPVATGPIAVPLERPPVVSRVPSTYSQTSSLALPPTHQPAYIASPALSASQVSLSRERRQVAPAPNILIKWEDWGGDQGEVPPPPPPKLVSPAPVVGRPPPLRPSPSNPEEVGQLIRNLARASQAASPVPATTVTTPGSPAGLNAAAHPSPPVHSITPAAQSQPTAPAADKVSNLIKMLAMNKSKPPVARPDSALGTGPGANSAPMSPVVMPMAATQPSQAPGKDSAAVQPSPVPAISAFKGTVTASPVVSGATPANAPPSVPTFPGSPARTGASQPLTPTKNQPPNHSSDLASGPIGANLSVKKTPTVVAKTLLWDGPISYTRASPSKPKKRKSQSGGENASSNGSSTENEATVAPSKFQQPGPKETQNLPPPRSTETGPTKDQTPPPTSQVAPSATLPQPTPTQTNGISSPPAMLVEKVADGPVPAALAITQVSSSLAVKNLLNSPDDDVSSGFVYPPLAAERNETANSVAEVPPPKVTEASGPSQPGSSPVLPNTAESSVDTSIKSPVMEAKDATSRKKKNRERKAKERAAKTQAEDRQISADPQLVDPVSSNTPTPVATSRAPGKPINRETVTPVAPQLSSKPQSSLGNHLTQPRPQTPTPAPTNGPAPKPTEKADSRKSSVSSNPGPKSKTKPAESRPPKVTAAVAMPAPQSSDPSEIQPGTAPVGQNGLAAASTSQNGIATASSVATLLGSNGVLQPSPSPAPPVERLTKLSTLTNSNTATITIPVSSNAAASSAVSKPSPPISTPTVAAIPAPESVATAAAPKKSDDKVDSNAVAKKRTPRPVIPGRGKVLLQVQVETTTGSQERVTVCELDDIHKIAREFCIQHNMMNLVDGLVEIIDNKKKSLRSRRLARISKSSGGESRGPSSPSVTPAAAPPKLKA